MPTIRLSEKVKKKLEEAMITELQKEASKPQVFLKALKNKYGYTHNEFIEKLLEKKDK